MSAFVDTHDILEDFLAEAGDMLEDVDSKLMDLERTPGDAALLNCVFRGFHTIKGGAGFLEATPLVDLCHRTESLFDRLRGGQLELSATLLDLILAATGEVRRMFGEMASRVFPTPAPGSLLASLDLALDGGTGAEPQDPASTAEAPAPDTVAQAVQAVAAAYPGEPDWAMLYAALVGGVASLPPPNPAADRVATPPGAVAAAALSGKSAPATAATTAPASTVSAPREQRDNSIRVETGRFDHILNLTGEIGLTTNRLACLRKALASAADPAVLMRDLEKAIGHLDMMVDDLQSVVMKARMQPMARLFQKYSRLARDVARSLGKEVELDISGEDTEVDKTILDELNDPLIHLVRNAIDHGVEAPADRKAAGKPPKAQVRLSARQAGDQLVIEIADDGRGMRPEAVRDAAVRKGLIAPEAAALLDERQSLNLIFLPGFSTKEAVTDLSGRGVGMDVVLTNIRKLKGRIEIDSRPGQGTTVTLLLPLTLAILPVLMLKLGAQPFAVPLSAVNEILPLDGGVVQQVAGNPCVSLRGTLLPYHELAHLLGRERATQAPTGVVVGSGADLCVIGVDGFLGQDEMMIKPIDGVKPRGVAGATQSGEGELVLVLELRELIADRYAGAKLPAMAQG